MKILSYNTCIDPTGMISYLDCYGDHAILTNGESVLTQVIFNESAGDARAIPADKYYLDMMHR